MIWESFYWKQDLKKLSIKLVKRTKQQRWIDISNANAEKEIMFCAFISRKLFDSQKMSVLLEKKVIDIIKYNSNGEKINLTKRLSPEKYFLLNQPIKDKIIFRNLCNQIIHSYIFTLIINENGNLTHFWVASDYDKFKSIYEIEIKYFIKTIKQISEYWPKEEHYKFNRVKNEYEIYRK